MVWEGVPWMVDEADHQAETGRLIAYLASGQNEGIAAPLDLSVVASAIPDGNVHILSGAASLLNRFPGGGQQSYAVRNEGDEVVALAPQGSSGVRYDLVAVVVEDPQYPGQPAPVDVANGPYVKSKVYTNVDPATRHLFEVDPDQTGYALALVKFDASDGTVTNSDITDLRQLVLPRSTRRVYSPAVPANQSLATSVETKWPDVTQFVNIPMWATKAVIVIHLSSFVHFAPHMNATMRIVMGGQAGDIVGLDLDQEAGAERSSVTLAATLDIDEELRGTTPGVYVEAKRTDGAGTINTWQAMIMVIDVNFYEEPV